MEIFVLSIEEKWLQEYYLVYSDIVTYLARPVTKSANTNSRNAVLGNDIGVSGNGRSTVFEQTEVSDPGLASNTYFKYLLYKVLEILEY